MTAGPPRQNNCQDFAKTLGAPGEMADTALRQKQWGQRAMKALTGVIALVGMFMMTASPARADALTTQDYVEIEQLYAQYNHSIDAGDAEGWAATFTPDGTFNRFAGHDALVGFVKMWREQMNGANRRHWNTNLRVVGTSDGANGAVYLMLVDVSTRPASIAGTGTYSDTLVKTPKGWRFKSRTYKGDAPPAAAGG